MTVQYNTEKVSKKKVFYGGTDTLYTGYALCYDRTVGTDTDAVTARAYTVIKPTTETLPFFAGVVHEESSGKTGPGWFTIVEPNQATGVVVPVYTDQPCTIAVTQLGPKNDSYALGAYGASAPYGALAMQTVDRSGTPGVALAQLMGVNPTHVHPKAIDLAAVDNENGTGTITATVKSVFGVTLAGRFLVTAWRADSAYGVPDAATDFDVGATGTRIDNITDNAHVKAVTADTGIVTFTVTDTGDHHIMVECDGKVYATNVTVTSGD